MRGARRSGRRRVECGLGWHPPDSRLGIGLTAAPGCSAATRECRFRGCRVAGKAAIRQAECQMTDDGQRVQSRIDVDEALPSVEIPRRILNALYAHAIETLPEECCGLIVGTDEDRYQRLVRCRNEMTMHHRQNPVEYPRDGSEAVYMSSLDYMMVHE